MDQRSKNFCYTLNNYAKLPFKKLESIACKYHIYGMEEADTGTPHLQGFIVFLNQKTLSAAIKILPKGCHVEVASGTPAQNITYCSKDGDIWSKGDPPLSQAEKGEAGLAVWQGVWDHAVSGNIMAIPVNLRVKYYNIIKAIAKDHPQSVDPLPYLPGIWYCGPPGSGKTSLARRDYPDGYWKLPNKWWDGYIGQNYVIIDDLSVGQEYMGYYLKIWADHYPYGAETKGGHMFIRPKVVVVTSNYHPSRLFAADAVLVAAIERRFTIVEM